MSDHLGWLIFADAVLWLIFLVAYVYASVAEWD